MDFCFVTYMHYPLQHRSMTNHRSGLELNLRYLINILPYYRLPGQTLAPVFVRL
jgi:hypothetical protein